MQVCIGDNMKKKLILKFDKMQVSVILILLVTCSMWLFDGIVDSNVLILTILSAGVILLGFPKIRIEKYSLILVCYLAGILLSLFINGASLRQVYQSVIVALLILQAMLIQCGLWELSHGIKCIVLIGELNAVFVVLQFLLKDSFNSIYYRFLSAGALDIAKTYYSRGYYFGVNYRPHETAGAISFGIVAILLWGILQRKKRGKRFGQRRNYIAAGVMLAALLLTGKKGIMACLLISCILVLLLLFGSKKQWIKAGKMFLGIFLVLLVMGFYISTHPNNALVYRFAVFFQNFSSGEQFDSGRSVLYGEALLLWHRNIFWGVGWRHFADLSVSVFGHPKTHEVNLDYLQFLCETGITGFTLMMIPILVMVRRAVFVGRMTVRRTREDAIQWIVFFAVFVQLFTMIYGFIEDPFYDVMFFSVYIFSCIIINNAYRKIRRKKGMG